MKTYTLPNGTSIASGEPFTADRGDETINFPANWIACASQDDLKELGIVTVDTPDPPPPPAPPRLIEKSVIIDRLNDAGLLQAARTALDSADLYTRERWNTRNAIYADDETAVALLKAIGADPEKILAP